MSPTSNDRSIGALTFRVCRSTSILHRSGEVESNLVWKDTVLVRTGQVVDILLDVSNPELSMAHCHIAEHAESGMMFSFRVAGQPASELTGPAK